MYKSLVSNAFVALFSLGVAASPVGATVINFAAGTPSHSVTGPSLMTTPGTVSIGEVAVYVRGGDGLVGRANSWPIASTPAIAASEIGDHQWLQGDPPILFSFTRNTSTVVGVPGIDHGPLPGEALEWVVWGSDASGNLLEEGWISAIYDDGVDPTPGVLGESDDFTSIWNFKGAYQYFVVKSGTHCTNTGCNSPGEFEIDGLALLASPVPVPASLPLLLTALGGFGLVARRRRKAA